MLFNDWILKNVDCGSKGAHYNFFMYIDTVSSSSKNSLRWKIYNINDISLWLGLVFFIVAALNLTQVFSSVV